MSKNMEHKALPPAPEPQLTDSMIRVRTERLWNALDRVERQVKAIQEARAAGKRWVLTQDGWELQ